MAVGTNILAVYHACLWNGGTINDLRTLGGTNSEALAINTQGQIVGWAQTPGNTARHAFLYSNSTMTDLGTLGGQNSEAHAINDRGQIVGMSDVTNFPYTVSHPFLYSQGQMSDLAAAGTPFEEVDGLSYNGQVVGGANSPGGALHAFLFSDGAMTDLNSLIETNTGWVLQIATGMNDGGQIVGLGYSIPYLTHAFLMTPRPALQNMRVVDGHAKFELQGMVGFMYRVDYALSQPPTNWIALTNLVLPFSPCTLADPAAISAQRYYRAVQIQ